MAVAAAVEGEVADFETEIELLAARKNLWRARWWC